MKKSIIFFAVILTLPLMNYSYAENGFTPKDRELLLELRVKIGEIDKRFEQLDKRFEQIDKRLEELRQDMNSRFEMLFTFLWIITAIFTTLTISTIGFAYWDRRTIIGKAKEETIKLMETSGLTYKMLEALRELSKEDKKVANVLRQYHLM